MDLVQYAWRDLISDDDRRALRHLDPQRGFRLRTFVGAVATNRMISELRRTRKTHSEWATAPKNAIGSPHSPKVSKTNSSIACISRLS